MRPLDPSVAPALRATHWSSPDRSENWDLLLKYLTAQSEPVERVQPWSDAEIARRIAGRYGEAL